MFKDFPSLHPLAVHFPIVLILLGAVFQAVVVWKDWKQIHWTTLFILAGAFFSGLAAATILHALPSANAPEAAMEIFEQHEKFAQLTLWMSGITLLLKSIGIFFKINRLVFEVIVLTSAIAATTLVSITGHHGARLTHVAGVGPMGRYLMKDHHKEGGDMKDMDGMEMKGDSSMKMDEEMHGKDTAQNRKGMDKMKNMPDMHNMKDKKDMKGMKSEKGMDSMKDMRGTDMKHTMANMKEMDNMKDTKDMSGMNMKDTSNMNMPARPLGGSDMKSMKMPLKNAMDTFRFPDNNPALKKNKKPSKP